MSGTGQPQTRPARTSRAVIADVCGITESMVGRLARDGIIPGPDKRNQWPVTECCKAYVQWLKTERSIYTSKELAELLEMKEPNIHKYKEEGMPQLERGRWNMPECVRWIIRRERDMRHKHGGKGLDARSAEHLAEENLLAARENRMLKQLAREEKERTLVRRDECESGWRMLTGLVTAALEAMPGRLSGPTAGAETVLETRRILFDEVRRIRQELFSTLDKLASSLDEPQRSKRGRKPGGKNNPKTKAAGVASGRRRTAA